MRRLNLTTILLFLSCLSALPIGAALAQTIVVHKTPTCGCCNGWVDYLRDEGFDVITHNHDELSAIKAQAGLTDQRLMSCHTALIDGYVVEGHVPANDIRRLISEQPDVLGITAPGMPQLSPGMGSRTPKDYNVLSFGKNGEIELFSMY